MTAWKILLLGVIVSVSSEICPSVDHMRPCTCKSYKTDILVSCYDEGMNYSLWQIEPAILSLEEKENVTIKIDGINLGKVPTQIFVGIGLVSLSIDDCELDSLFGEPELVLTGLEDTLEHLEIYNSLQNYDGKTKLRLGHLRKLKYLALTSNRIKELGNDFFEEEDLPLETLTIDYNGITHLGDHVFAYLSDLKYVFMDGNHISSIKREMFPIPADYLDHLNFRYNDITSLPKDMFKKMSVLSRVSFAFNKITRLEEATWEPVWGRLDYLNLTGNPLECDSHMDWMFDVRAPSITEGNCAGPAEQRGRTLQDFINKRGLFSPRDYSGA